VARLGLAPLLHQWSVVRPVHAGISEDVRL
jgi:hypothetical protein